MPPSPRSIGSPAFATRSTRQIEHPVEKFAAGRASASSTPTIPSRQFREARPLKPHDKARSHSREAIETGQGRLNIAEMDYRSWRESAAQVLRDRHDLVWGVMHEGAWSRLYVKGCNPEQAAELARTYWYNTSPSQRLQRCRMPGRSREGCA